jgi:O-antigen ligase
MRRKFIVFAALLGLMAFFIPIEHKYDKVFRFFSLTLIPKDLAISPQYDRMLYFYPSDILALLLIPSAFFLFRTSFRQFFGHTLWLSFLFAFLSIVASPFSHYPVCYAKLLQLLTPVVLFSFLKSAFNDEEKSKLTQIIWIAIVLGALFQSSVAIAQHIKQAPLGLRIFGETRDPSIFVMDGVAQIRSSGTFLHANAFGGFIFLSILSTYGLIATLKKWRWLFTLTLPLQFYALGVSYSRSAIIALALASLVWFSLILIKEKRNTTLRILGLIIFLSMGAVSVSLGKQYIHRGGIISYNELNKSSDGIRIYHQKKALEIIRDHPFFGLGLSQFSERAPIYFEDQTDSYAKATAPHNVFLFFACETGLFALACLLYWIFSLAYRVIKTPLTIEIATLIAILTGFLFISFCDFYLILFHQGKLMLFLTAGLLAAHTTKASRLLQHAPLS